MTDEDRQQLLLPLLDRQQMCDDIEYINRVLGFEPQQAMDKAIEVLIDFQRITEYPPTVRALPTANQVANNIDTLIDAIIENRNKEPEDKKE